ncbi:MAG: hypothetical protein CML23_07805 [Rhizobiaceae bacterium]|uniref:DUF736 family protein n=1 Tax=Martelella sp. TaxID=1969699 RepID=UPI000C9649CC|nr:hypothetical protein [Rhizobiaceae bacterium]|tara:strand:- start:439 stop:768 length:330 start_codon:yes stop_codon:yes gene_type:complete
MTELSNFIRFNENGTFNGNFATVLHDFDVFGTPVKNPGPKAPKYRVFAKSPRGRAVEIGGIWENEKKDGDGTYLSLAIRPDLSGQTIRANLGRFPGQDDEDLQAIILWS